MNMSMLAAAASCVVATPVSRRSSASNQSVNRGSAGDGDTNGGPDAIVASDKADDVGRH